MKHLAAALIVALCAFAVACDDSDSEESSSENGEAASDDGEDNGDDFDPIEASSLVFQGDDLPLRRVECEETFEEIFQVYVTFDLEPRGFTDLQIRGTDSVSLRLPTQVDAEDEFDVWEPANTDNFEFSEDGAFGTIEMEGVDRGAGEPPGGTLELDLPCTP